MLNRTFKEYAQSHLPQRRRGTGNADDDLHPLDLFSRNRPRVPIDSSDRLASLRLGKISVGSVKSVKSGLDDLLTSADSGKHDYDWLLTPPETPLFPSEEGNEFQHSFTAPRRSSAARSVSTSKPSRLATTRVESNASSRPARSSSVTRSSVSSYSQYSSIKSSSSILNTSSASVSSYIRPSSPITRSSSTTRPSTPGARTTPSRSSTPSRTRSSPSLSSIDKPRPSYSSRPSSPISRPQISTTSSRPSTPTRRSTIATSSTSPGPNNNNILASSVRGMINNGRNQTSGSRPSSPNPSRIRSQQSATPPDYSHDTPPNLRTTMSDRPVSAGRSRPASIATPRAIPESQGQGSFTRRASSPIVTRGRSVEPKGRNHSVHSNGYPSEVQESRRSSYVPDSPSRRNVRVSSSVTVDSSAYGRSISKKSLDMAIKHMDSRDGSGTTRPLGGTVRYPQSVRSSTSKIHSSPTLSSSTFNGRLSVSLNNGSVHRPENGKYYDKGSLENGRRREENGRSLIERLSGADMFESARYDAILLTEDLKNTNWLLSSDENSDYGMIFDPGYEPLPEPFGLS